MPVMLTTASIKCPAVCLCPGRKHYIERALQHEADTCLLLEIQKTIVKRGNTVLQSHQHDLKKS